ncbi:disulfide bond formation protein B, partial [Candidatus Gottesmanbacteria bacterium]|nr:disulfide bond formation protein B [Candidatus Gottesmanbacteria bacterium]
MSNKFLAYFSWFVATVATAGSLYFSEIARLTPCVLCWYQRILMYPLVLI